MTIIAVKDGVMATDSHVFVDGRRSLAGYRKVARSVDGDLAAAAGDTTDCYAFTNWFGGRQLSPEPRYVVTGGEAVCMLILRADGSLWRQHGNTDEFPVRGPYAMGEPTAESFCIAAMLAGLSAPEAVALTIKHCVFAGGDVQVERLAIALAEAAD